MANLDNLPIPSLSSLDDEEGLALILSVRERRRAKLERKQPKLPTAAAISKLSEAQITDLYYKLMAKQQKELL